MFPNAVKQFLYENNEKQGCYCVAINDENKIVQSFGNEKQLGITAPSFHMDVGKFLPGVLTETFSEDFEIPFYNINSERVCNLYFLKFPQVSYLILIDKSEIFNVTQKYQQYAHDDNISKNKFKRLAKKLKKSRKKLKKSNQEKATLIAMLSHELGTPLTSIIGYSELLLKNKKNCKKSAEIINRNANDLKHMIENTLMFGSSEANGFSSKIQNIKVGAFFSGLKNTLQPVAAHKNLSLKIEYNEVDEVNIDIIRTKQILINLLNNAVKYTEKGSICLSYKKQNGNDIFTVSDTGLGVPVEMHENIFNPWKRLRANQEKGTGIGLFISQKLAQTIGGKLKLLSSTAENGSVFQLIIPSQKPLLAETQPQINLETGKGKTLLIIDDDDDILMLIEALLDKSNLSILTASNFPQAKSILLKHKVDIVLTDYNLGSVKASSFIKAILKINKNLPVLLMTAMSPENKTQDYISLGFMDVISKPLNSKELLLTIFENIKENKS